MLYRAGSTLQMALFMYREKFFDKFIETVERRDGEVILVEGWYSPDLFYPFPDFCFHSEDEKRAALLFRCCEDALTWMHKLILSMLQDFCSQILEVATNHKNRKINMVCRFVDNVYDKNNEGHLTVKVVLENGETYALDIAGAQFGYFDPVLPWSQYLESQVKTVKKIVSYGHSRLKGSRKCHKPGAEGQVASAHAFVILVMERAIDQWVSENMTLQAMLKLPEAGYEQKRSELLDALNIALQGVTIGHKETDDSPAEVNGLKVTADDAREIFLDHGMIILKP